jgi:hypothetical protein
VYCSILGGATIWTDEAVQTVYDLFPIFPDLFLAYD